MANWELLIDEQALASVLPGDYSRFARPVRDALAVFLEGLPESTQAEVLARQAELPPRASISHRLGTLARCCPVLHKLGQVLARDRRLAPELREHLRELESLQPTVAWETIEQSLADELGSLEQRHVQLVPPALAEASVAVVVPFQRPAASQEPQQGVFKILKPGIQQRLGQELQLLEQVGQHLDERCEELQIPHLDYQEAFQLVRDKLLLEVQLGEEQRRLQQAGRFYADEPRVLIPTVMEDLCTPRVTAMQRVSGGKVTDRQLDRDARRKLAELIVQALIARPVFAKEARSMFHSDPHAGNLFLTDDGRLSILDWSLVGSLGERERIAIVQVVLGAVLLDQRRIVATLEELAERPPERPALQSVVAQWLRRLRQGELPGLTWLVGLLDTAAQQARLRLAADLMLFRKTLHTLEGVIEAVDGDGFQIDFVLLREFLRRFAQEWPSRWFSWPGSRDFATRLSNLDLVQAVCSGPSAMARYWMEQGSDLLDV